tara:strand:+ start:757 stop:1137 length:381 start_codon:yes stop_codon:yes gene_type:complete
MLLATFEPGQEIAIANFFLAIFLIFTIALPLLLITRGEKTEANREFLAATVNPWAQITKQIELTPVVISGVTPTIEVQPKLEVISGHNSEFISDSEGIASIDKNNSEELVESSTKVLETIEEVIAA